MNSKETSSSQIHQKMVPLISLRPYRFTIFALSFWILFTAFIFTVPPLGIFAVISFFAIFFLAFFSSTLVFFHRLSLNILLSILAGGLLLLQYFSQLTLLNLALISGLFAVLYFLAK
ncbi:MAG TPA: hypothetical protein VF810_04420 [Patescibacteria group bacterium]